MFPLQLHLQVSFTPRNTGHQKQGHHSWRPHCPGPAASHSGSSYSDGESAREEVGARGLYLSWFPQRSRRDAPRTHLDSAGLLPEAGGVPDPKTRYCPVSTEPPLPSWPFTSLPTPDAKTSDRPQTLQQSKCPPGIHQQSHWRMFGLQGTPRFCTFIGWP